MSKHKHLGKIINWGAPLIGVAAIASSLFSSWANSQTRTIEVPPDLNIDNGAPTDIWQVKRVSDGDTITVMKNGEERRIRFCGIDAPEKDQPGGKEATELLDRVIREGGNQVAIEWVEQDRYGRWVAEVWSAPGTWNEQLLNSVMVGHAWPYKQFWNNCPNRQALEYSEKSAEQVGNVIWQKSGAIPPWEWRKRK